MLGASFGQMAMNVVVVALCLECVLDGKWCGQDNGRGWLMGRMVY